MLGDVDIKDSGEVLVAVIRHQTEYRHLVEWDQSSM